MNGKKIALVCSLILFATAIHAQIKCDCEENLALLHMAVKENYAGYNYKTQGEKGVRLNKLYDELVEESKKEKYKSYNCARILESYITAYEDKHTRINYLGLRHLVKKISEEEKKYLLDITVENIPVEEEDFREYLKNSADLLEGIYENDGDTCIVVKNSNVLRDYVGIILGTDKEYYNIGQVKFELKQNSKNQYDYFFYNEFYSLESRRDVKIDKKNIDSWEKIFPGTSSVDGKEKSLAYAMQHPDSTVYMRLATFTADYKSTIDNFLEENKEKLSKAPNLILDLRGNGGGRDDTFSNIVPYLYTNPIVRKGVEFYCSENTIQSFEMFSKENEENTFLRALTERMRANEGKFVPFSESEINTIELDTVLTFPKNIYIIVDENSASSAEEFVLIARQSSKVKILGENTSGCLDFSNIVQFVPKGDTNIEWWNLDYASSISQRIPENPVDDEGIVPDVYLSPNSDWMHQVYRLIEDKE